MINEFDGLEFDSPIGRISGEDYRKDFLSIDYPTSFKWAVLGINLLLGLVGLVWGCWVCENVRHDNTQHKVKFHVPRDVEKRFRVRKATATKDTTTVAVDLLPPQESSEAYFTFSNVSYTVDVPVSPSAPEGKLKLLNNVNGFAKPGMMIALMGTSGAGKTTLLDVSCAQSPSIDLPPPLSRSIAGPRTAKDIRAH